MSDLKELIAKYSSQVEKATCHDKVYKDECAFSFATPFSPNGLLVCLNRFIGVSQEFLPVYFPKSQSHLYLRIKSTRKEIQVEETGEPEKKKPSKFGIGIEGGFTADKPNYSIEHEYSLYIYPEDKELHLNESSSNESLTDQVNQSIMSVINAESNALKEEVASMTTAWDGEKRFVSKHSANLKQLADAPKISPNPNDWKCSLCDVKKNLWMNLSDGTILCGRKQLDGSGGNQHAVDYYEKTKYPLAVKLGTVNAKGADVYSYDEDDMVEDSNLAIHLAHFGINMSKMEKSEKSLAEMEIDLNQKVGEWDRIQESGSQLIPMYGPGYTGLQNLGNSCYMNSVMQVLFTIPDFVDKYSSPSNRSQYLQRAPIDPANDFNFQMSKLSHGLLSGSYSTKPITGSEHVNIPKGIKPLSFKSLMGRGHPEFSTKRQQDAHEYLMHVVNLYEQSSRTDVIKTNPFEAIKFQIEERIECAQSKYVKYTKRDEFCLSVPISKELATNKGQMAEYEARKLAADKMGTKLELHDIVRPVINLINCLKLFSERETIDDFYSTAMKAKGIAYKTAKLATFPDYLFIQARKFELSADWSPIKIDVSLQVPDILDLSEFRGVGKKPNEQELAEKVEGPGTQDIHLNENVIVQLVDMGFSIDGAKRAAYHTRNNNDPEAAVNWCMSHMEDSDFNSPFVMPNQNARNSGSKQPMVYSEEGIAMLTSLGFNRQQAIKALEATNNDIVRAADWIFSHAEELMNLDENSAAQSSEAVVHAVRDGNGVYKLVGFISHMGTNANTGHYVAHILNKDEEWCIFNDENVAKSENPPKDLAYLYLYRRV